jgi:ABC-type cobalamin/Fe3+-siderophores transport system ATPase subunit
MTLELRNVSKRFPGVLAVDNVSFSTPAGEITGYLGPNGSGKSTTMKMIAGLIDIGSGEILFGGDPSRHDLIAHKQRTGYVPEEPHAAGRFSRSRWRRHGRSRRPCSSRSGGGGWPRRTWRLSLFSALSWPNSLSKAFSRSRSRAPICRENLASI